MKQIYTIILLCLVSAFFFACQNDDLEGIDSVGYLRIALEQNKDVNTKAADYNAKQMHVDIIDADGNVKQSTDDHTLWVGEGKELKLKPGEYTVKAVSNGWDGTAGADRAYYAGETKVTIVKGETTNAEVKCSLANVKVTVSFSSSLLKKLEAANKTIKVQVKSLLGSIAPLDFTPESKDLVVYYPVSDLEVDCTIESEDGETNTLPQVIENVKAKEHHKLTFRDQSSGTGNITIKVDPSMTEYTYDFTINPNPKNGANLSASAWPYRAYLNATDIMLQSGDYSQLKFQYSLAETESWTDVDAVIDTEAHTATATVTGLAAQSKYIYRLVDASGDELIEVAKGEFTTETTLPLPNGSFQDWSNDGKVMNPWAEGDTPFWGTGNPGAANFIGNLTTSTDESVSGMAAKLESKDAIIKLGAGNIFTGDFELDGTNGILNVGRSFTSRPISLQFHYKYTSVAIGMIGQDVGDLANLKGRPDSCQIYIALADKSYELKTKPSERKVFDPNDAGIIAYGQFTSGKTTTNYQKQTISLEYKATDREPKYIIVVASASKYGDYFIGGVGSTLWLDEMELIYDGEPNVSQTKE